MREITLGRHVEPDIGAHLTALKLLLKGTTPTSQLAGIQGWGPEERHSDEHATRS